MKIHSIEIYINDVWLDITSSVENNIELQSRCDEAFAVGEMKAWLNLEKNIPPYTPLKIQKNDNSIEYYFCSSTTPKYLTYPNLYVHSIEILELTAVLDCFILGSKYFSVAGKNKSDASKLQIVCELMSQKYGYKFNYDFSRFTKENEFCFGPGTTMFSAFTQISLSYNLRPKVTSLAIGIPISFTIEFATLDLGLEYRLKQDCITNVLRQQNTNNYCGILEGEMSNVIDRNSEISIFGLTFKNKDGVRLSKDNLQLLLPTRAEEVTKIYALFKGSHFYTIRNIPKNYFRNFAEYPDNLNFFSDVKKAMPISYWASRICDNNDELIIKRIIDSYLEIYPELNWTWNWDWKFNLTSHIGDNGEQDVYALTIQPSETEWNNTILQYFEIYNYLLPKEKYDLLLPKDKPYYVYFNTNDNVIDGFNLTYKDDFWNFLFDNASKPSISANVTNKSNLYSHKEVKIDGIVMTNQNSIFTCDDNDFDLTFGVTYKPIVNMLIKDYKNISPENETSYKRYARSYDKGANFIDFDRLEVSIRKSNDSLGQTDLAIEYVLEDQNPPKPAQKISYGNKLWYVASVIESISSNINRCIINLVVDYNKVADAIGVPTQYNTLPNPMNDIIDRPIYLDMDMDMNIVSTKIIKNDLVWVRITNSDGKYLYKKGIVLSNNKNMYVVCEAYDNYCFDKRASHISNDYYAVEDVPYADSYNERETIKVGIVNLPKFLSNEDGRNLPYYDNSVEVLSEKEIICHKDSRERLTFSIKINII